MSALSHIALEERAAGRGEADPVMIKKLAEYEEYTEREAAEVLAAFGTLPANFQAPIRTCVRDMTGGMRVVRPVESSRSRAEA